MASVYKRNGVWISSYRGTDGKWKAKSGGKDKVFALQQAVQLETEARKVEAGFITESELQNQKAARLGIEEHLEAYAEHLASKGNTTKHVAITIERIKKIIAGCGFTNLSSIRAEKVTRWLSEQRQSETYHRRGITGMSIQTSNYYVKCIKSFCRWCVNTDRVTKSPVDLIQCQNTQSDRRHDRKPLSDDELARLIAAAAKGDSYRGVSGKDRAILYRVASQTGLRAREISTVTVDSFDLDKKVVTVQAAYTKNRKQAQLPLRDDLVVELREHFKGKNQADKAFAMPCIDNVSDLLAFDLEAARQQWIKESKTEKERQIRNDSDYLKYRSRDGRYSDFHSLRHRYITSLVNSGANPKIAQMLARHSDIRLTLQLYTHADQDSLAAAVNALPGIR